MCGQYAAYANAGQIVCNLAHSNPQMLIGHFTAPMQAAYTSKPATRGSSNTPAPTAVKARPVQQRGVASLARRTAQPTAKQQSSQQSPPPPPPKVTDSLADACRCAVHCALNFVGSSRSVCMGCSVLPVPTQFACDITH